MNSEMSASSTPGAPRCCATCWYYDPRTGGLHGLCVWSHLHDVPEAHSLRGTGDVLADEGKECPCWAEKFDTAV